MKAFQTVGSVLLLLLFLPSANLKAQLRFVTNNGSISIIGCTNCQGNLIIPPEINGLWVTDIGEKAFYANTNLTGINLPGCVTNIGTLAFGYCALTNITLQAGLLSIGKGAFYCLRNLTEITLPNTVVNIGPAAFDDCFALTHILIPASVTNIGYLPFVGCESLQAIMVADGNLRYRSLDGVLFDRANKTLIKFPEAHAKSFTFPAGVNQHCPICL